MAVVVTIAMGITAALERPAESAEPSDLVIAVTPGENNVQELALEVPDDPDGLGANGAEVNVMFAVFEDVMLAEIHAEPVLAGETATAEVQLELAGEYQVAAWVSDGTVQGPTPTTVFSVAADLPMPDPEVAPEDNLDNFNPPPVEFNLTESYGAEVRGPLLDGYSYGEVVENGEAIEVLDPDGNYVGVIHTFAVLEDGTQLPVTL